MNLFEINEAIEKIRERDDVDPTVMADTLDSLKITREEKLDGIAGWIQSNQAKIDWISKQEIKLRDEKTHLQNQNKNLMSYMTTAIDSAGIKQLKTAHHLLRPRNYRAKTIIDDETKLGEDYRKTEQIVKIDKKLLYQDLKAGRQVSGAHLEPNRKTSIL